MTSFLHMQLNDYNMNIVFKQWEWDVEKQFEWTGRQIRKRYPLSPDYSETKGIITWSCTDLAMHASEQKQ